MNDLLHLPVIHEQALRAGSYEAAHKDPFDRMLAAQAELESMTLVTADRRSRTSRSPLCGDPSALIATGMTR